MLVFLLIILLGLAFAFFVILVFGLLKSACRADQSEEKLLAIITQENDKTQKGDGVEETERTLAISAKT